MKSWIKITRQPYEEPYHLNLVMTASNGLQRGQLEYYCNANDLNKIAEELEVFPRHATHVYLYELGSERSEDRFAFYFRFRLSTISPRGSSVILLRFNNNKDIPYREITEFCIPVEPAALNRLGRLFQEFALLKHEVLYWDITNGELYETKEDAEQSLQPDGE
jgi:hypothetical protein